MTTNGRFVLLSQRLQAAFTSPKFRLAAVIAGFLILIILRQVIHQFALSLGYIYILLVALAGFWFGWQGGLIAAAAASALFVLEISVFTDWPGRDLVAAGIYFRIFAYFLGGIMMGYLHQMEKRFQEEHRTKERLEQLAYRDELTGCVNYRWGVQMLEQELASAKRHDTPLTVAMLDLDLFKDINDKHGHQSGNAVLKYFSDVVRSNVRAVDTLSRYGGDEFLLILPQERAQGVLAVLERIKKALAEHPLRSENGKTGPLSFTFSAGIASYPQNGSDVNELINAVDHVLYEAKRAGRDRFIVEKRSWVRLKPNPSLTVELVDLDGGPYRVQAVGVNDISQRGLLLLFPEDVPEKELLCRISLSKDDISEIKCRVVHGTRTDEGLYRVGVLFADLPDEDDTVKA